MSKPIPKAPAADEHPLIVSLRTRLRDECCKFMIFGPNPASRFVSPLDIAVQAKRRDIKTYIESQLKCIADFPEELFASGISDIPALGGDILALEKELARREYDLVIMLLNSPGTLVELGGFCSDPELREKLAVFHLDAHSGGLAANTALSNARHCFPFRESEIASCNLMSRVGELVARIQKLKFFRL